MNHTNYPLLISGYAPANKPGIHTVTYNAMTGDLQVQKELSGIENPSFITLHPNGEWLYAVSEIAEGVVWALRYDLLARTLIPLNHQSCGGHSPCHLTLDFAGRWLLVANYVSGSVGVLPVQEDGTLGELTDLQQHSGKGSNPERQDAPHAHSTIFSPDERFVIAADLGADTLFVYQFNKETGRLIPHNRVKTTDGAGPRHMVFHPNGQWLYVANELDNTVTVYRYDAETGKLSGQQTLPTVPPDAPPTTTADIHLNQAGNRLFVSNRGHDSLAIYAVGPEGTLTLLSIQPCGGQGPRNFALTPDDKFVLVANEKSNDVIVFAADIHKGLGEEVARIVLASPTCVLIG